MAKVHVFRLTRTCVSAEPSRMNMSCCMEGRARDEGETKAPSKLTPEDNRVASQAKHMTEDNGAASQVMVVPVADRTASHDHPG